jgi:tight adherence protein C
VEILFVAVASISFAFLSAALLFTFYRKQIAMDQRISRYFPPVGKMGAGERKKSSRLLKGIWMKGTEVVERKTSKSKRKKLEHLIRDAGYSGKVTALEFRLLQIVISIGGGAVVFFLYSPLSDNVFMTGVLACGIAFLGFHYCTFFLSKKRTRRIAEINRDMPDFFDTVNLLIEAGLGIDSAILNVCEKKKGPLSEEFLFALEDMQRGKSRREAFYELKLRVPSDALQTTLTTMIQADYLGVGMSKVIRNLTIRLREQRRESAREQAMKAPVKMLFPMVFFIFPAIFIIVLGPLVIKIMTEGLM